jgi:hypothetical protein
VFWSDGDCWRAVVGIGEGKGVGCLSACGNPGAGELGIGLGALLIVVALKVSDVALLRLKAGVEPFKVLDGNDWNTEELLNFKNYLGLIRDLKKLIVFADIIPML